MSELEITLQDIDIGPLQVNFTADFKYVDCVVFFFFPSCHPGFADPNGQLSTHQQRREGARTLVD